MYLEPEIETMPEGELAALKLFRLINTLNRCSRSLGYQKIFKENGVNINKIKTLEDLRSLPFTTKNDLRENYPWGFLTVAKEEVVRLHSSSGTTGQATVVLYSKHDLDSWANLVARCMYMAGAKSSDIFQNMSGYGMFTGGLGFQYGAEWLGMITVPAGAGNSKRQLRFIQDFGTTVIHILPSYALHLGAVFKEEGLDPASLPIKIAFIGAEPHSDYTRKRIETLLGVKAYNSYGLSEMNGPGVAFECQEQNGLHIWEDSYIAEIINPKTLEPVPNGEVGELVITSLNRQAMPLIRFRTRDLTRILPEKCPCGRTHIRLDRFKGRSDDMLIVKGVNVFPLQIETVLMNSPEVGTNYSIVLETINDVDVMTVNVEVREEIFTGDIKGLNKLSDTITTELKSELLFTPKVKLVEPGSLPQSEGKAVRVIDKRNLH